MGEGQGIPLFIRLFSRSSSSSSRLSVQGWTRQAWNWGTGGGGGGQVNSRGETERCSHEDASPWCGSGEHHTGAPAQRPAQAWPRGDLSKDIEQASVRKSQWHPLRTCVPRPLPGVCSRCPLRPAGIQGSPWGEFALLVFKPVSRAQAIPGTSTFLPWSLLGASKSPARAG